MYCYIKSAALWGLEPYVVEIEADISTGLPYFNMVGLLSSEVREARERVRSAIRNIGESLPLGRVTINLSPADRKKEGTAFDLPIAVALLCAMGRLTAVDFEDTLIVGELGLNGEIRPVRGILPVVLMAQKAGFRKCIIPWENRKEAMISDRVKVLCLRNLKEVMELFLSNTYKTVDGKDGKTIKKEDVSENGKPSVHCRENPLMKNPAQENPISEILSPENSSSEPDFSEIRGQETVKRAFVVAVAGHHHLLMTGAPGVGKSMLANRVPGIMPPLSFEERLEVSGIYSVCGCLKEEGLIRQRPFMAPHHTITTAALIGGGQVPVPGVITLAHRGVLFLDELPEFHQMVLDSLRQPLEEKKVRLNRNQGSYTFPADCLVIAAMNPCKCGYYPDRNKCHCSETEVRRYQSRISGPLLDRLDMSIEVPRVHMEAVSVLSTQQMRDMVLKGVRSQKKRQGERYNSQLSVKETEQFCVLGIAEEDFMRQAYEKLEISMRGYHKLLKIARTIADIEESEMIRITHLAEALQYRMMI